jgi:hypothetical protein
LLSNLTNIFIPQYSTAKNTPEYTVRPSKLLCLERSERSSIQAVETALSIQFNKETTVADLNNKIGKEVNINPQYIKLWKANVPIKDKESVAIPPPRDNNLLRNGLIRDHWPEDKPNHIHVIFEIGKFLRFNSTLIILYENIISSYSIYLSHAFCKLGSSFRATEKKSFYVKKHNIKTDHLSKLEQWDVNEEEYENLLKDDKAALKTMDGETVKTFEHIIRDRTYVSTSRSNMLDAYINKKTWFHVEDQAMVEEMMLAIRNALIKHSLPVNKSFEIFKGPIIMDSTGNPLMDGIIVSKDKVFLCFYKHNMGAVSIYSACS